MLRLSPMAKKNEQYQQKRLTSFLCFSKSLIFFSYTSTSQGLVGVFSAAFPVWEQHKTFPNPQHTWIFLNPPRHKGLHDRFWLEHFNLFFFKVEKKIFPDNDKWTTYLLWRVDIHLGSHSGGGGLLPHWLLLDFGSFCVRRCCRWSCHWHSTCDKLFKFLILQPAATKKNENESG